MGADMRDPDLDRRLVGWMREGPYAAPPDVVARALVETTTIVRLPKPRKQSHWRAWLIATALAAIVLVAAVALIAALLGFGA